jgi:sugar phosphate isomerase/epimerase
MSPRLIGQGNLPIGPTLAALKSIGYAGWYSLETEKRWRAEAPEPEESIPQFVNFMTARLA